MTQWERIDAVARASKAPALLYREPDMAVRVIREEFNKEYRGVVIDDRQLYEEVRDYVASINPELADRVEYAGDDGNPLPVFERHHVHEQVHKALDRKVWLPSGGSLIIERTEALTVIDVNTGKNVGTSNLEETVFRNNLEAAEEIARQLRLRDIGGIIVIDFIDMEIAANRAEVIRTFRESLARDKTRTQVFDISELGLGGDDPQAHLRGPRRVVLRDMPDVRRPRHRDRRVADALRSGLGPGLHRVASPSCVCGDQDRWKAGAGRRGPAGGRRTARRGRG